MFQVSQQEEEPIDFKKRIENMIQYQNDFIQSNLDCTQSINRLEAQMSYLINTNNDRNEETVPPNFWPFSIPLTILIGIKNHGVLETLTRIQFHHNKKNLLT